MRSICTSSKRASSAVAVASASASLLRAASYSAPVILVGILEQLFGVLDHLAQIVQQSFLGGAAWFRSVHDVPLSKQVKKPGGQRSQYSGAACRFARAQPSHACSLGYYFHKARKITQQPRLF
jgi:hypothetical protein